jgi:HPr kinase/phosphorylase
MQVHGALVQVQVRRESEREGVGVLLLGPSGVGKSEAALELVTRGHRLVADDVVELSPEAGRLFGCAPQAIRHYLEIRGLGILFVPELYGAEAVLERCAIDLVCRLDPARDPGGFERVGLERPQETLGGVALPSVRLPVRPATSLGVLVEAAARDHRMRARGPSAAERLDASLRETR